MTGTCGEFCSIITIQPIAIFLWIMGEVAGLSIFILINPFPWEEKFHELTGRLRSRRAAT
jgi:hypothetical protein